MRNLKIFDTVTGRSSAGTRKRGRYPIKVHLIDPPMSTRSAKHRDGRRLAKSFESRRTHTNKVSRLLNGKQRFLHLGTSINRFSSETLFKITIAPTSAERINAAIYKVGLFKGEYPVGAAVYGNSDQIARFCRCMTPANLFSGNRRINGSFEIGGIGRFKSV